MLLFWVTIHVLLHQGNTLTPVVTVQLGQPVTLRCLYTGSESISWLHWYKQTTGDTLKLILMTRMNTNPIYGPGYSSARVSRTSDDKMANLTILKTTIEDEGMYHCAFINWLETTWSGTYLSLKENSETTSSYRVVQQPAVLDLHHKETSETLRCSLVSQTETETCAGDPSVFWFKTGSDKNSPDLIYSDGKIPRNCKNMSNTQKKCSYNFSKNINSSDVGTYYCAVATCKEIFLGHGTRIESAHASRFEFMLLLVIIGICLAISVILNIVFICCRTQRTPCTNLRDRRWRPCDLCCHAFLHRDDKKERAGD
ncbi:T cell receptor alpha chain MC.7.G5-like isoform X2 [Poeciliopsis prolifica]|uniref:T cell receptor alpha chain MC.7.G5-like isoform X2 n=1 Tax=Poeciliopsis prolifica TaxID=188132 RepID=UPI0024139825|nr:T cell receptor alpha chain MC.7.G5-like isoform X2 [Poeciliopsis prolifica]